MKKWIVAVLALLLLAAGAASALAEEPELELLYPADIPYGDQEAIYALDMKDQDGMWASFWLEDGEWRFDNAATYSAKLDFKTDGNDGLMVGNENVPYVLYVAGEGFSTIRDAFYASYVDDEASPFVHLFKDGDMEALFEEIEKLFLILGDGTVVRRPISWYPHNTVCAAGLEFREVKPGLTSKWYNFVPIDLSQDGRQVFDLAASNMYVVGFVTVDKQGDEVTVRWGLNKQATVDANFVSEKEYLTFFHDIDSVTSVEPTGASFAFGKPLSISRDLDGDTNVLLYICNTATYCSNLSYRYQNLIYHPRYNKNDDAHAFLRRQMTDLMDLDQPFVVADDD